MKKSMKRLAALIMALIVVIMCVVPANATWTYPDGGTLREYIADTDNFNRTIYVYHRDSAGTLLKYCEYYTGTIGKYDVFGDSLYGYDIVSYESNQGIGESCVLTWAAGNESTAGYGQIGYQFYKLISKNSLTLNFTYRKQEATTFNIKHYLVNGKGQKTLYASSTESHQYGDYLNIHKKSIPGYELDADYLPSIAGTFTYDIVKASKNISDRLYYDFHKGSHSGEMYDRKSYSESYDDYLDYCNNREINVCFSYHLKNYSINFNANGGIGAPAAVMKYHGVDLILPDTIPTRSGYTFKGWGTSSTSTSPSYQPGGRYTSNSSRTLYAVWESDAPTTYTVSYNANGGSGAPASQTKTKNATLTLSSIQPQRSGYSFLGWSTNSTATSVSYNPGDSYTANASVTLYAVWDKTNNDFSISDLTVSNSAPYKREQITVKVRTDSWDQTNAYSDIPVQLYYDGRLVSTKYVDFSVYGVANITFTLNVGSSVGNKSIEARINWADRNSEARTENNTVSTTINVQDLDYDVSITPIKPIGVYGAGMEVVSSFYVANDSDYDIIPSMHNTARFTAYYYNGSRKVVISTQDWDNVVIPAASANLVYFKWRVPTGIDGKPIYLECTVNADRHMNETNYDNNTTSFSTTASTVSNSQTPDTRFEGKAPSSYQNVSAPSVSTDKATWTMWEYENGSFSLKKYGIQISPLSPVVTPSSECATAVFENGKWTMRSGYGITMSYAPGISTVSGYNRPDSNAYTSVQYAVATFPEFRYFDTNGNCRTLQYVNGSYQFVRNSDADGNARVHFIPVYVRDGNYTVSVTATHVWTPAGMIEATRNANVIIIDGTIYDDWYQG